MRVGGKPGRWALPSQPSSCSPGAQAPCCLEPEAPRCARLTPLALPPRRAGLAARVPAQPLQPVPMVLRPQRERAGSSASEGRSPPAPTCLPDPKSEDCP